MFDIIRKFEESKAPVAEVKLSLLDVIKNAYRSWKGKRKFAAVAKAKRAEKAVEALSNAARAEALEKESDALVLQTIGLKDRTKVDELLELAADKAHQADMLRHNI